MWLRLAEAAFHDILATRGPVTEAVASAARQTVPALAADTVERIGRFLADGALLRTIEETLSAADGGTQVALSTLLQHLTWHGVLTVATAADTPLAIMQPVCTGAILFLPLVDPADRIGLSRFVTLHPGENGRVHLESPRSSFRLTLQPRAAAAALALTGARSGGEALSVAGLVQSDEGMSFLRMLVGAGVAHRIGPDDASPEDCDPMLLQWEAHDLAFHVRSRLGYHDHVTGASYRFADRLPPPPPLKPLPPALARIPLPRAGAAGADAMLFREIEARRSVRTDAARMLTLPQLGAFLDRSAAVRDLYQTPAGAFTRRPYPSGGASYELEIYITADRVAGLERGFYYYDAADHALLLLRRFDVEAERMVRTASVSMAMTCRPQCVLTIAARHSRVSWKYSGMAYATQLKNVGVLYMTFYLAASALGLSPCALGLGDIGCFARLTGLDPAVESSVGEFALSGAAIVSQA